MNEKILIAFVVFGFIAAQHINAQTDTATMSIPSFYKYEIGISYGLMPVVALLPIPLFDEYGLSCPNFNIFQLYNLNKHHAIGATITIVFAPYPLKSDKGYLVISPQFQYKITYIRKKNITMYSAIAAGMQIGDWLFCAYQLDLFGISFGKRQHNGFVELGWGYQGLLKIGYKYKF